MLERPGGRIAYDLEGAGPGVVCIPGMGDLRSNYRYLMPALVESGFTVAAMDLRGHGGSDATFTEYDDVAAGQDALALAVSLGGAPLALVGNSMGAGAAVWAAAERPDLVHALVLVGPFVRNVPISALTRLAFRATMAGPWARAAWMAYLPRYYAGVRPPDFDEHRAEVNAALRRPGHLKAFRATTHTSHAPAEARLDQVHQPTLVVMGERDPDFQDPRAEAELVAQRLGGRVLMVPDAGHYPHAQRPEIVNPAVVAFLRG
jgi:pimeloyl-ACP methyl ester carboxylesterase